MTTFFTGYFTKMAQLGVSQDDARLIAEYVVAQQSAQRKRKSKRLNGPLHTTLSTAVGTAKGALTGAAVSGLASYADLISRRPGKPLLTEKNLTRAIEWGKRGLLPGAVIGGVVGAVK